MRNTKQVQAYTVASGVIVAQERLLMVQNQRRNGTLDWSTPGGVVDDGEHVLEALQREVVEETCVVVDSWSPVLYSVEVDFVGRDLSLHAQVFRAQAHRGELHVDDPDNVVVDGRWVSVDEALGLLDTSPRWVAEPLRHYLSTHPLTASPTTDTGSHISTGPQSSTAPPARWHYRVTGSSGDFHVERTNGP